MSEATERVRNYLIQSLEAAGAGGSFADVDEGESPHAEVVVTSRRCVATGNEMVDGKLFVQDGDRVVVIATDEFLVEEVEGAADATSVEWLTRDDVIALIRTAERAWPGISEEAAGG